MTAGLPDAAERLRAAGDRVAGRALESALAATPTMRERYDEAGLRQLQRDAALLIERVALSIASGDPYFARHYADMVSPVYRRRPVPLDDLIALCDGLRAALPGRPDAGRAARRRRGARRGDRGLQVAPPPGRRRAQEERRPPVPVQGRLSVTIKWVQQDPLVLNGEPFCYGSRLTVRQLLELRSNGYDLTRILKDHPELRTRRDRRGLHVRRRPPRALRRLLRGRRLAGRPRLHRGRGGRPARPVPNGRDRRQVRGRGRRLTGGARGPRPAPGSSADRWYPPVTHRRAA